jgi:heme a synthase
MNSRPVIIWLVIVYLAIAAMVAVGGTVRLTGSGLSMVDWKPISGVLPPLGEDAWQEEFEQYKQSPQFQKVNHWMELDAFKRIFFWEYIHRLLGRLLGVLFALPWIAFVASGRLRGKAAVKTSIAFVLGGLQGLLGWYMVRSGLVDRPSVSHLRLGAHLGLALVVANYVLWLILEQLVSVPRCVHELEERRRRFTHRGALALLVLISVQVLYGAFVAGTHAGHLFSTFPDFAGSYWPEGIGSMEPLWLDLRDNPVTLHVLHRGLGLLLLLLIPLWSFAARRAVQSEAQRLAAALMVSAVVAQVGLGIVTVLFSVPAVLGVAHQLGGMLLLSCSVFAVFVFGRREP